jgi:hypothetical protein
MKIISEYSSLDYFAKNHVRYCHHIRSIVVVISFQISNSWMIPYKIYFFYPVDMDRKSKNHHRTKTQMLLNDKYVVVIADKAPNNIILCVNHIT